MWNDLSVWVRTDIFTWSMNWWLLQAFICPSLQDSYYLLLVVLHSPFACMQSRYDPLLSLGLLRAFWVPAVAPCFQLISVTILNFSQLLNVPAIQVPTLASLFFLSPAAPLPHSEFCSAFVLVWMIPCGLLPSSLYFPDIIKGNTWSARNSPSALILLQKTDCQKEQLQEITIGLYVRGGKVACVTRLWRTGLPVSTSLILADVEYIYLHINTNTIWMALHTHTYNLWHPMNSLPNSKFQVKFQSLMIIDFWQKINYNVFMQ